MKCSACSVEMPAEAHFCPGCGKPVEAVCPRCASPRVEGARFCHNCGTLLTPGPASRLTTLQQSAPTAFQEKLRAAANHIDGERKPVTILFTDIVGSTSLAEKLDPEEWKEIVAGAHARVSEAIYRYEGTIAQLLGDGVLAFFGAPITHEDDPLRAVHTGLVIQSAIAEYARSLAGYIDSFQMRIGIHTGLVVVGSVGTDLHMEYLAIGDSVNLAARLQSACTPGQVLISEATARRVRAEFELEDLGEIDVKGKAEAVHVYRARKPKSAPTSGRGSEGLDSPLVGRDQEQESLRSRLSALAEGHGQIVCITGEAGIGKSRLLEEGREEFTALHWAEGRSLSYGQNISFWAITQLLKNDLGVSDADPEPRLRTALRRRLQSLDAEHGADLFPYLAHLLGIKLEGEAAERIQQLDGETLKRQVLVCLEEYWSRVSDRCPTVLVFEDLHWADPSTLEALERLLALTDRAPAMVLLLFRVETTKPFWRLREHAAREYRHRFTEIELSALSAGDSDKLVENLLTIADLPATTRRLILDRAEGNPLYVEEIVRSLIDQGAITRAGDHWSATGQIQNVTIPETLQALLLARIDRLEIDARRTLQLASVIGPGFLYRVLNALTPAERRLDAQLAQLQRLDLVYEKTRRPELEYSFKHSLTQQAAYESLLLEERRDLHRRVGLALEQLFADHPTEYLGLLAYHFDQGAEYAKAVDYAIRAGDKLRHEDAQEEAIGWYRRAIDLLDELGDVERGARTWLKLGLVYHTHFEFDAAHRANETAFALQQKQGPRAASAYRVPDGALTLLHGQNPVFGTLDPAKTEWADDINLIKDLFAGLAELDEEMNVIPHAARSWEILDGGTRYVFHLRDDVRWTDGSPVTAEDYVWAWKRNLRTPQAPNDHGLLDYVVGAKEYREGKNPDPDSVRVRALGAFTLEVLLVSPVAFFIYVATEPITFPLPRRVIERFGDDWWAPEHIVSNGAFRLESLDPEQVVSIRRNPDYFGAFPGNLDGVEFHIAPNGPERIQDYRDNRLDLYPTMLSEVPSDIPLDERRDVPIPLVGHLAFYPDRPPMNDIRVRRALMLALDRQRIAEVLAGPGASPALGGVVPPGMPGHTIDLSLAQDVEFAKELLADAGYPGGRGFPPLTAWIRSALGPEVTRQWKQTLGIDVILEDAKYEEGVEFRRRFNMYSLMATTSYPDPAAFLQQSGFYLAMRDAGWRNPRYEELIEQAARATNRDQRMAMYREADRIIVVEDALVLPLFYSNKIWTLLVKPSVTLLPMSTHRMVCRKVIKREPVPNG